MAKQWDADLKRDAAHQAKAARAGRPGAQIHEAANPLVDDAVGRGIPEARARHDVEGEMTRLMRQGLDLNSATLATAAQMPDYVAGLLQQEMQRQWMAINGLQVRMRAAHGQGRGTGYPFATPPVANVQP